MSDIDYTKCECYDDDGICELSKVIGHKTSSCSMLRMSLEINEGKICQRFKLKEEDKEMNKDIKKPYFKNKEEIAVDSLDEFYSEGKGNLTIDNPPIPMSTQDKIGILSDQFAVFLRAKNLKYKDSALNPIKIFSKFKELGDTGLGFRMDDKLSRFDNSDILRKNDVVDTVGYLMLICIHMNWMDLRDQID